MTYAIIAVGGKQYRVREGERLLVDRLPYDEGKTFHPDVLLVGGDGEARIGAGDVKGERVTARVAGHVLGEKVVVGKYRRRTGYRRKKGHRSRLSQIEIQSITTKAARSRGTAADTSARTASSTPRKKAAKRTAKKKEEKQ